MLHWAFSTISKIIRMFHFLFIIAFFWQVLDNRLAVSLSKIFSTILILHLPWQTFFGRGEDGVIALELVFTARKLGEDHQYIWKSRSHLPEFWAIILKKILVSSQTLCWLVKTNQLMIFSIFSFSRFFCHEKFLIPCADFFNWNRVKLRYCDGASFTGDSQNQVGGKSSPCTVSHDRLILSYNWHSNQNSCYFWDPTSSIYPGLPGKISVPSLYKILDYQTSRNRNC